MVLLKSLHGGQAVLTFICSSLVHYQIANFGGEPKPQRKIGILPSFNIKMERLFLNAQDVSNGSVIDEECRRRKVRSNHISHGRYQ